MLQPSYDLLHVVSCFMELSLCSPWMDTPRNQMGVSAGQWHDAIFFKLCVHLMQQQVFFPPSLLSDKGLDFYGNEEPSHRVYMLNEVLDRVSLYWLFIIFFSCSVLSSNLNFLQLCLSSLLELQQFTRCLSILSCLMRRLVITSPRAFPSQTSKRLWDESHRAFTSLRIRGKPTFFYHPPKHPALYLMSAHAFHFISDKQRGRIFLLLTS